MFHIVDFPTRINKNLVSAVDNEPQINYCKKSHELRLIKLQTQQKNPEHMYLKFLIPLTTSVEKIVDFHGFN
jgi:hypothetical protein